MDEYLPDRFLCSIMSMEHWYIKPPQAFKIRTRALLQVPAVCIQNRHRDIISKQTFRVCQISDQSGILGGAGWGDSSPDPHQLPSKRALIKIKPQSYYLLLGVPPQLFPETDNRYGHLEEQHKFVSFAMTIWDLPLAGDGTTTGPLVAGQKVIPWRHLGNSETSRCGLLTISSTALNLQNNCFHCHN